MFLHVAVLLKILVVGVFQGAKQNVLHYLNNHKRVYLHIFDSSFYYVVDPVYLHSDT